MYIPTTFYPAIIRNSGTPSLFTNECKTAHDAKMNTQKLIDNGLAGVGTTGHAIAGFAFFNKELEIVYVFNTEEEMFKTLQAVKKSLSTGATRGYAKLKEVKKAGVSALNFLNKKETAKNLSNARTFKEAAEILELI